MCLGGVDQPLLSMDYATYMDACMQEPTYVCADADAWWHGLHGRLHNRRRMYAEHTAMARVEKKQFLTRAPAGCMHVGLEKLNVKTHSSTPCVVVVQGSDQQAST